VTWDAIVVGVGGLGAAAVDHLAARGLRVLGLERTTVPNALGSSHGRTRVIRKAYFEDPRYVPLLERAYPLWEALERDAGVSLLRRTGCLELGPRGNACIEGLLACAKQHGLPHEVLTADEVRARYPAFAPGSEDIAVFEADGGVLQVEACTRAHADRARRRGAEIREGVRVASIDPERATVTLEDGTQLSAGHLIVTAGAWLPTLLPALPITVERQVQLWFSPPRDLGAFPAFIHFTEAGNFYGIPGEDAAAPIKVCRHHGGRATTADTLDRACDDADEVVVRGHLRRHLPRLDGARVDAAVCMYANTPDENFLVGVLPTAARTIVVGGGSGHAYKMASVLGEVAADLVTEGRSRFDLGLFSLERSGRWAR